MHRLPPWSLIEELLRTLVLPAFAGAALVLAVICAVTKREGVRVAGGALALLVGLAAGNHFRDLLEWWPAAIPEGDQPGPARWGSLERGWPALLPVTAAALALGLLATSISNWAGRLGGVVARAVIAAGVAWWLVEALPPISKAGTLALLLTGTVLNHEALLFAASRTLRRVSLLALTVPWCATAAVVLIFAHSARFADLAGLMAASVCGVGLAAALWKLDPAALFVGPAAFLPPLVLAGAANTFSEVPVAAFACAAFAPCALWLLSLPRLTRLSGPALAAAAIMAVLVPCAAAIVMAASTEEIDLGE
jgi:hypothetical protein